MNTTELMAELVFQIGILIFACKFFGSLAKRLQIPAVLGELLAGVVIGPYALGGIALPGFPHGLFPLPDPSGGMAVSVELYAFATVASIILLFCSGLETDLALFLKYSVAGGIIGIGGVIFAFGLGAAAGVVLLHASLADPRCLFLGILSTATSVGITARILSDQKKMDSPEGVTILAAAVFDDVLGIIALAVVMGIVTLLTSGGGAGGGINAGAILAIAAKAFGIWLGFTVLGLLCSKKLAAFLKIFRQSSEFSILSLGVALLLAGFFEKQGLAMIIGAYIAGLSLSKTDISAVIQERIHGIYEFFVPLFFAVMGMMVNVSEIMTAEVLSFGAIYTGLAILAKVAGCGLPALFLGFNLKGALRIGTGMVPRGEVALIIAGIGMSMHVLDPQLFGVIILMTFITTLAAPPLLSVSLRLPGIGTREQVKDANAAEAVWDFRSDEIADLVVDTLLNNLRSDGFYIQMLNIDEGLSQARKDNMSLSITEEEAKVTVQTSKTDMPFVRTAMYEVIVELNATVTKLQESANPKALSADFADAALEAAAEDAGFTTKLLNVIQPDCVCLDLKGTTKIEVITELIDVLAYHGRLSDRNRALADVLEREEQISTGMRHGIAMPHGRTDGAPELAVAVGVKKEGVDFKSMDGAPSRLFILVVSPRKTQSFYLQFLSGISVVLSDHAACEAIINAPTPEAAVTILQRRPGRG